MITPAALSILAVTFEEGERSIAPSASGAPSGLSAPGGVLLAGYSRTLRAGGRSSSLNVPIGIALIAMAARSPAGRGRDAPVNVSTSLARTLTGASAGSSML